MKAINAAARQWKMLKNKLFTDFTIVIDETSHPCHAFPLISVLGYFQDLLESALFLECKERRVELRISDPLKLFP
jgi:hypothetical protein